MLENYEAREKWIEAKFEELSGEATGKSGEDLMDEAVIAYYDMREVAADDKMESEREDEE